MSEYIQDGLDMPIVPKVKASVRIYTKAQVDKALAEQRKACISSMKKLVHDHHWNYAADIFDALYKACEDARIEE